MSALHVRTEPLGGSPLSRAAVDGHVPAGWYEPRPTGAEAWRSRLRAVAASAQSDWATRLAPAMNATGAAAARVARVAASGGAVVTTGQQPGLFGGPIYTWSKAVSALALADELEAATGVPVAPIFWAATDDADFAEAASTWIAGPQGAERLSLPSRDTDGRPMAELSLGDGTDALLARLLEAAGSAADPGPLDAVRGAYVAGATIGDAYVRLLRALLEPLGIAVLDASHPAVRLAADGLLRTALVRAPEIERSLATRTAAIEARGLAPQVAPVAGLSLVFARDGAGKERVPLARAADVAAAPDAELGPNVLLRPVVERAILPTAAYVAGPGEIAYFAQVGAVADALGAAAPLVVPRWSCTLIEPGVQSLLDRHGLEVDDLADPHAPERRLAQALLPDDVTSVLRELRASVTRAAEQLGAAPPALLPADVASGFERQVSHRVDRLERRYRAAVARREYGAMRELALLRGALYPGGARQERALNIIPLLARFGRATLVDMTTAARDHAHWLLYGESPVLRVQVAALGLAAAARAVAIDGAGGAGGGGGGGGGP